MHNIGRDVDSGPRCSTKWLRKERHDDALHDVDDTEVHQEDVAADLTPKAEAVQRMMRYNERLAKAGALPLESIFRQAPPAFTRDGFSPGCPAPGKPKPGKKPTAAGHTPLS